MVKKANKKITISNNKGLHARAACAMVLIANNFNSDITVCTESGMCVNAKSPMDLLMLAAEKGTDIEIEARGDDAQRAIEAISDLVDNKFNEDE